jgi:hypothetical protein
MLGGRGRMIRIAPFAFGLVALCPSSALAHASRQSFVLLLPTGFYIAGGVAAVALTVALIALLPAGIARGMFGTLALARSRHIPGRAVASLISFALLAALVGVGLTGSHDPTRNPLPLAIWTLFWIGLVLAQGIIGDLWRWLNPWTGPVALARRIGLRAILRLPSALGHWPAVICFLAFAAVLLTDPAPSDPGHLALMVAGYWGIHFAGSLISGPRWLMRAEALTVLMRVYALLSPYGAARGRWRLGLPGWKVLARPVPSLSLTAFMIALLATGSFDGLYETFWWLGLTGFNPLEHPGRSAVIGQSLTGLICALPLLALCYGVSVGTGLRLIGHGGFALAFRASAPALLPIAFAYHFAHYLPALLVDAQNALIAFNDPFDTGANLLGLSGFRVTAGFFNRMDSVRIIWLAQAGAVVAGHMFGILTNHAIALRLTGDHHRAALMQAPLAVFMITYTLFGLWLLAAPRGV